MILSIWCILLSNIWANINGSPFSNNQDRRIDIHYTSIRRESVESMSNRCRSDGLCYLSYHQSREHYSLIFSYGSPFEGASLMTSFPQLRRAVAPVPRTLNITQRARFTWPTWGLPGSCWPQVGPMLAPWTLLSGKLILKGVRYYRYFRTLGSITRHNMMTSSNGNIFRVTDH